MTTFVKHIDKIGYMHFADSDRTAPGQAHIHFSEIVATLNCLNYDKWISVEILPIPDPDTAASQAIGYLRTIIPKK